MHATYAPDSFAASSIVAQVGQPNAGVLVECAAFRPVAESIDELARVPAHRLHYWQMCDAPPSGPPTTLILPAVHDVSGRGRACGLAFSLQRPPWPADMHGAVSEAPTPRQLEDDDRSAASARFIAASKCDSWIARWWGRSRGRRTFANSAAGAPARARVRRSNSATVEMQRITAPRHWLPDLRDNACSRSKIRSVSHGMIRGPATT